MASARITTKTRSQDAEIARSQYAEIDWYDTPRYYDIVFDADTRREADFLEAVSRSFGRSTARLRVLEPACGSGRLVAELARRGHRVTGFDLNPAMLAHAREKLAACGLKARLFQADLASFETREHLDLAHCLVSTFKYLLDEKSARSHLHCVANALAPGGIYVLGFHLSDYEHRGVLRERWSERRRATSVVCNTQLWPADRRTRLEAVRTRLIVQENGRESRSETRWMFRAYDTRQVRALLRSVPELEHIATFDFTYRADAPRTLSDEQLDCVLILRRRS